MTTLKINIKKNGVVINKTDSTDVRFENFNWAIFAKDEYIYNDNGVAKYVVERKTKSSITLIKL